MTDPSLRIAVFIDFDNIEIGVKTTLHQMFDIAVILEAIKERGEVVTKVAYGDWKRAGDHGRLLSQHAIRMVQRNLTPGGDKNGADINLALDALEMVFTHAHINAFVIVGGDSDFITLVEKLKQYDKKVFVVGGRQFTSLVMQKNCHEFIAYENLVGGRRPAGGGRRSGPAAMGSNDVKKAIPLVKRALKVLVDREVSPQLGLLKSTLLQLDSTFSERDYGASTFRGFMEKVAQAGLVTLRHSGRSVLVDLADSVEATEAVEGGGSTVADGEGTADNGRSGPAAASDPEQGRLLVEHTRDLLLGADEPPRWPMYVRQVRQYLRSLEDGFDERTGGFASIVEFLRACQREGVLRLERNARGILRVFPGERRGDDTPTDGWAPTNGAESSDPADAKEPVPAAASFEPADGEMGDAAAEPASKETPKPRRRRARKASSTRKVKTAPSEEQPAADTEGTPVADTAEPGATDASETATTARKTSRRRPPSRRTTTKSARGGAAKGTRTPRKRAKS